jgi:N-acetyl-gamma-glutamyl-phosphate reductase common form
MEIAPKLPAHLKVIDLSGDFRLKDADVFARHYTREHTAMNAQSAFVYGLTETNRGAIKSARCIANPGCFATATLLGLAPLVANPDRSGLSCRVIVDAKTGSSGSGAKAAANTHHPQRSHSFYAYKPFTHQHVPEIEQELKTIGEWKSELVFMTHSLPVSRGIFASIYTETKKEISAVDACALFAEFYRDSSFVRLVDGSPDINWVKTTNFCDIGFAARGRQLVVFTAIDNLVKGAAGQAVQNMNLMFGLDERTGLMLIGTNP